MLKRYIPFAAILVGMLLSCAVSASAKDLDKFLVRGYIYDEAYKSVDSVEVSLTRNDTIKVPFKLLTGYGDTHLNKGGSLRMMVDGGMGNYCLVLEKEGYEPLVRMFTIASVSEDLKYLSTLIMEKERHHQLGEVTVQATRVKMVMKGDTIVFDAAAFKLQEGSMLDALVRQLPGATLSTDGVIEINGRKINELLVNGKDFFQGDPKVALQNLPAYTVKNLKVYDKADKDAYLTHSDAKLDKQEENENLVMDVVLKKEFDAGYMANAEAGYGTRDRYMGRAFGLGYTNKFRLAAFVNANNIGDSSQGGTSGQWRGASSEENGLTDRLTSGLDYNYTVPDKIESSGSVVYTGVKSTNRSIESNTRFFESGDIFGRKYDTSRNKSHNIRFRNSLNYKFPNVNLTFFPVFSWNRIDNTSDNRSATFTANPSETYRGQALDSLFRPGSASSSSFYRTMLTQLRQMKVAKGDMINGEYSLSATIRPKSWKGMLMASSTGSIAHSDQDSRTLYNQSYGPASTATSRPIRNDRFSPVESNNGHIGGALRYSRDYRRFGDVRTTNFGYTVSASYRYDYSNSDDPLYTSDSIPDMLTPPSAQMMPYLTFDPINSPYTFEQHNGVGTSGSIRYSTSPTNPGDSTINPSFNVQLSLYYDYRHFDYHYLKTGIIDERVEHNTNFVRPMLNLSYSSSNKIRNITLTLYYQYEPSAPPMSTLVNTYDSSDPFRIVTGNPNGLTNIRSHFTYLNFMRFSRGASNSRFIAYLNWQIKSNDVAWASRYNPSTGVTLVRPENISGNWSSSLYITWSSSFGKSRNMTLNLGFNGSVQNSADYVAKNADPVRSSVFTQTYRPDVSLDYTFKQGSTISVGYRMPVSHQHSERENFNNMTWYEYWPYIRAFVKMPADFALNTQFNPYFRRGFTDPAMNTSEYVWDATLTKTFKKPAITLKLSAHDILGSAKHVYTEVNAQGRAEIWRYTLPRYVMLTVGYRLDMKPRSGKSHNSSRRAYDYIIM